MSPVVGDEALHEKLTRVLEDRLGLYFPPQRWRDLDRGIASAAPELGFESAEQCAHRLVSAPLDARQIEVLAAHLTVGETYFFRDPAIFGALEERVLPELIAERRTTGKRLRIWSAGCCTGEEPYSLAILLSDLIRDIDEWEITLLATDINPRFLRKAVKGEYSAWSFRGISDSLKKRCFVPAGRRHFQIRKSYRRLVTFASLNLVDDAYPSPLNNTNAMDLIVCRNVLMYLTPRQAARTVENLCRSLRVGGWLVVSPSEVGQEIFTHLERVGFPSATLFRKPAAAKERISHPQMQPVVRPAPKPVPAPEKPKPRKREVPASGPGPLEQAANWFSEGRYSEAASLLEPIARNGPQSAAAAILLSRCRANEARLDEALSWCERAIEADKLNMAGHYLRAAILQEQSANDEAIAALRRALFLDDRFVMAHFALASLLQKQGRVSDAARHFRNAADLIASVPPDQVLPESEGLTAARLSALIESMQPVEPTA